MLRSRVFGRRALSVPGPSKLSVLQAVEFGRDPYAYLTRCQAQYGDTFTLQLPRDPVRVVFCRPDDVKQIFAMDADAYRSDTVSLHLNLGDQSVLFADGERHRRKRQLLAPPMHMAKLRTYADAMLALTDAAVDTLEPGKEFTGYGLFRRITLDVILQTVFGVAPDSSHGRTLTRQLCDWMEAVLTPGMFALGLAMRASTLRRLLERDTAKAAQSEFGRGSRRPWRKIARYKADLLQTLRGEVQRCREQGVGARTDVLALLVEARYEDGEPMEEDDILDQLVTMLVGGFETTTTSLVWAMHYILGDAAVLSRVQAEIESVFEGGPVDPSRCSELELLEGCIRESMRLSPIAIAAPRALTGPQHLGGHDLPGGTIVWPCMVLAHRSPESWERPNAFEPDRFLSATPKPNVYFPFGGGRRRCLGATFAQFEMRIVLARVLQRCQLERLSGEPKPVFRGIAVTTADDLRLRVTRVSPAAAPAA